MKKWQRLWLYFVLIFSIIHFGRDILQELHIDSFLTKPLDNAIRTNVPRWNIWLGFVAEGVSGVLAFICLRKNKFGLMGKLTFFTFFLFLVAFVSYYLFF